MFRTNIKRRIFFFFLWSSQCFASYSVAPINRSIRVNNPSALSFAQKQKVGGGHYFIESNKSSQTFNSKDQFGFETDSSRFVTAFVNYSLLNADIFYQNDKDTGHETIGAKSSTETRESTTLQLNGSTRLGPFSFGLGYLSTEEIYTSLSPSATYAPQSKTTTHSGPLVGAGIEIISFYLSTMLRFLTIKSNTEAQHSYVDTALGAGFKQTFSGIGTLRAEVAYQYRPESKVREDLTRGLSFLPKKTNLILEAEGEYDLRPNDISFLASIKKSSITESYGYASVADKKTDDLLFGVGVTLYQKIVCINYFYETKSSTFGNESIADKTSMIGVGLQF